MITLTASDVRSISTRGMPAEPNSFCTWSRIFLSCRRNFLKSFLPAYQRERQGSMVGMRKPVGWIFCPMVLASGLLASARLLLAGLRGGLLARLLRRLLARDRSRAAGR